MAKRNPSVQAAINKPLHQKGASVRVQDLFLTQSGKYRGSAQPTSNADQLIEHRETVLQAARKVDPGVKGLEAKQSWWWIKVHAIPVARFVGKGSNGTEALREELEAENEGLPIPSAIRWLSGAASVKTRYNEGIIKASSMVLAVKDEETYRLVRRAGLRLQDRRYDTEAYEEVRPDVRCGHCSGWGHIGAQCPPSHRPMWLVHERTRNEGPSVPRGQVQGQERPMVPTHRG